MTKLYVYGPSQRKEPCDDTRGIIKISKSRASHQHPMQDKILTINSLYQWPQTFN